ncbi:pentapeptide repeat-containing protein [Stenotrophomonas sp.]|uniref:pentapeptide repeat-containing protein n=1 Tax=Stenotrophomonas sp. TaxID=69392 RepID=UPI0028B16B57|nr:pentapeptide repeat-containing protein [Stenotrophomonas sp.]
MIKRPGDKVDAQEFSGEVKGRDFSNSRIEWCRAKGVSFVDCDFSSSLIKNCYFHRASFKNCKFVGCTIVESNMRGVSFASCDFEYATFRSVTLEAQAILRNLPSWANARRELLRGLRKNAESIGEVEDVRLFLAEEMRASEDHWRSALRKDQRYYAEHYSGFIRGFVQPNIRLRGLQLGRLFWGHGDSPFRLLLNLFLWVIFAAIILVLDYSDLRFLSAMKSVVSVILGVSSGNGPMPEWLVLALAASRFVFLSLFAAVFVRRFARR